MDIDKDKEDKDKVKSGIVKYLLSVIYDLLRENNELLEKHRDLLKESNGMLERHAAQLKDNKEHIAKLHKELTKQGPLLDFVLDELKKPISGEYSLGYMMAMKKVGGLITSASEFRSKSDSDLP